MAAAALLAKNPHPTDADIDAAIAQHLPLRHLSAHPRRDPGRGAAMRGGAAAPAMKRRALLLSGVGAAGALVVGWGLLPPRGRLGARRHAAGRGRRGRPQRLDQDRRRRRRHPGDEPQRDGPGRAHRARDAGRRGARRRRSTRVRLDAGRRRPALRQRRDVRRQPAVFIRARPSPATRRTPARAGQWVVAKVARELGINVTGGSSSVADAWDVLRLAAATARAQLVGRRLAALEAAGRRARRQERRGQPSVGPHGALRRARGHGGGDAGGRRAR